MSLRSYSLALAVFVFLFKPVTLSACEGRSFKPQKGATKSTRKPPIKSIRYKGKTILLNEKALYLNAKLKESELSTFSFKTLQDAEFAKDGTEQQPTVIYMEPDVYWTDDPKGDTIKWSVSDDKLLSFSQNPDGSITVIGTNNSDSTQRAYLKAETEQGIQSLVYFDVSGIPQEAPQLVGEPEMHGPKAGILSVAYDLDLKNRRDNSSIVWYRSTEKNGRDSIKVAVSTAREPLKAYQLTTGDIGYYLLAKISPKHNTSKVGDPVQVLSRKINAKDVSTTAIITDFKNLPTGRNTSIKDGFWTVDTYRPKDLSNDFAWTADAGKGWEYGWGTDAAADRQGLMTTGRGARLPYPQGGCYKNMSLVLQLSPHKAAGQGFGSAIGQYLDIYTKFDTNTLSGYGLRIERTPKYGNGVQFTLYKFTNGIGTPVSASTCSSAFLPGCKVELDFTGDTFSARVSTASPQQQGQKDAGLQHEVHLSAKVEPNSFGGFGVQHTGSTGGASRIMLEGLEVRYKE